ncbi:MAG: hypothetical protein ACXWQO_11585 [Bdellovibrionota bacterium]
MSKKIELVGRYAAILALIEVSLGSVLHVFHIPFSGNFLSLNQGYLLCRATLEAVRLEIPQSRSVGLGISNVSAVLKSLAPAGKKLGPMLSLSMQGLLFTVGVGILGPNLFGLMVGMILLSLWTFLQPLITYYLFFGSYWFAALDFVYEKTVPYTGLSLHKLALVFLAVVAAKALFAAILAILAWRNAGGSAFQERLLTLAIEKGAKPLDGKLGAKRGNPVWLAVKDMGNPLFLFSLAATAFFLYFSEAKAGEKIWIFLRPLAVGFLFFYFSRTLLLDRWLARLEGTRFAPFANSCQVALTALRRFTGTNTV